MTRQTVLAFNCADQREQLATRTGSLDVELHHVSYQLPWEAIAARRAGRIEDRVPVSNALRDRLAGADVIFGFALPLELAALAPRLQWVETPAVGYDQLNGTGILEKGIPVTTVGGLFAGMVAEHTLALLLALTRRLDRFYAAQARRAWAPQPVDELRDATLAIVGLGNIGQAVARLGKAFGMRVVGTRRREDAVPPHVDRVYRRDALAQMLAEADAVVVAVAGTEETRNLIGRAELAAMKRGTYFINVARGMVVDEAAVAEAMQHNRLAGVGLDVFLEEPLPTSSPLWTIPNVIITPHVAVNVPSKLRRAIDHFCDNLARFCRGEPLVDVVHRGS